MKNVYGRNAAVLKVDDIQVEFENILEKKWWKPSDLKKQFDTGLLSYTLPTVTFSYFISINTCILKVFVSDPVP